MKFRYLACIMLAHCATQYVQAAAFAVSADGSAVVRLHDKGTVAASELKTDMLTKDWTAAAGSGGSMAITNYDAQFKDAKGGAEMRALYDNGGALGSGKSLEWVQIVTTNAPLGGATSPHLDNQGKPAEPFYTFTAQNRDPALPAEKLNFYDFPKRNISRLDTVDSVDWDAKLFPVIRGADKALTVKDGVTWGWTMKKATVGDVSGKFGNPAPATAVVSGVGTNNFAWGTGEPSSLTFAGNEFHTKPDTEFTLGRLTFHNGTIAIATGADSVDLTMSINLTNVPEKNFDLKSHMTIVNTPNTSDPIASADTVAIDGFHFTFNVLEGQTASVDVMAKLTTGLHALPTGAVESGAAMFDPSPYDPDPLFSLVLTGLTNPSAGGFITAVPEPASVLIMATGLLLLTLHRRRRTQ
ncbi:hypothetical protein GCM10027277_59020 [Pseudoduganella ginsengisoli]|uniref:PEP-CTERM sorting domain-containing protein n=1 Tax=Pseudoduganella ginsengisoli TaxID=1462440 RepID=A0A6L6Q8Y9_9BURK|nr:choice-of-anchor K domain-containing protein [Pseudoduganella ginsengisoli]MTW06247.1 PEP-CTERM sorting domain-containing protein [Pseudoduganella ginsengisoli]